MDEKIRGLEERPKHEAPQVMTPEEVDRQRAIGQKRRQVITGNTLIDANGKEVPWELVEEMKAYAGKWRKENEDKYPAADLAAQCMAAVLQKFNVKIKPEKRGGPRPANRGSNYTPPKKRRKK